MLYKIIILLYTINSIIVFAEENIEEFANSVKITKEEMEQFKKEEKEKKKKEKEELKKYKEEEERKKKEEEKEYEKISKFDLSDIKLLPTVISFGGGFTCFNEVNYPKAEFTFSWFIPQIYITSISFSTTKLDNNNYLHEFEFIPAFLFFYLGAGGGYSTYEEKRFHLTAGLVVPHFWWYEYYSIFQFYYKVNFAKETYGEFGILLKISIIFEEKNE